MNCIINNAICYHTKHMLHQSLLKLKLFEFTKQQLAENSDIWYFANWHTNASERWTRFEKPEQQKHRSNTINITENVVYSQQQIPNSMAKHFKDNHSVGANTKHNPPVLWEFRLVLCHSSCSYKPPFDTWIQKVIVNNKQLKCQSVLSFEMNCNWIWKRVHANIIGVLTTIET